MEKKRLFFLEAIKDLKSSGTVIPSSKFLAKRMLSSIDFSKDIIITEFGPGNGVITREILRNLSPNSKLICFELNTSFVNHLNQIDDDRLIILSKSAEDIKIELAKFDIHEIDYCVSGLPLTNIPNRIGVSILNNTNDILKKEGSFIQFQYSLTFYNKLKKIFHKKNVTMKYEVLNFPPAFVYICKKK